MGIVLNWARRSSREAAGQEAAGGVNDRFFDNLPDAAVLLDRVGTVVSANQRLADLTGYTVKQLIGQPAEFIGLPMAEEMPGLLEEAAAAKDRLEHVTLVRRDMKPVPAVIRYAWLDPDVRSVIVGVARETGETGSIEPDSPAETPRKSTGSGHLEFDRQGIVRSISRSLADTLETTRDQLIGTSLRQLIHRDDLSRIASIMAPRQGRKGQAAGGTFRLQSGTGDWIPLKLVGNALEAGGEVDRFRLQIVPEHHADSEDRPAFEPARADVPTGFVNRDEFIERIGEAFDSTPADDPVVVLFLNIDRFKAINEQFGYATGDEFIIEFARRLKTFVSFADTIARVGGDEFAILPGIASSHAEAMELAEDIAKNLADQPLVVRGIDQYLTASIGIALTEPGTISPAELLRRADGAAARAKRGGRGKIQIYESSLEKIESDSLHLEQDLLNALKRDELAIYYQPEVDLNSGAIVGVEALIRWNHPSQGFIEPSRFIPTAEDSGLIDPIGLWVLERSAAEVSGWIARFGLRNFTLAVNYSANQFINDNLVMELSSALRRASLPPSALRVEITESVLIEDDPAILKRLAQIKRLGSHLAIDDFGTGRASMSYLRSLPVDCLKVDRSFVSGASAVSGELSLTRSIAALARQSDLDLVVEGIESASQLKRVREFGCTRGQGYYFSRPVAAETIEFLLMAGPRPFAGIIEQLSPGQASASNTSSS
ncbi:MAG: EAL domain-containing protein [Thermomicrobiales bacterium]